MENNTINKRNITLDYFKVGLSILVIMLHCPFVTIYPPQNGNLLENIGYIVGWELSYGLAKISVPLFFIINGYFLDITSREKTIKYLTKLIILYIVWTLLYLPWFYPQFKDDIKSLIITTANGLFHLWYLVSVIGAIIILYLLNKIKVNKLGLIILSIAFFFIGYFIQKRDPYSSFEVMKYRNFLFWAFPFVTIGHLIKYVSYSKIKKFMPYILAIGSIALMIEAYIYMEQQVTNNLYIVPLFLCPALFLYVLKNGKMGPYTKYNTVADMSIAIFLVHPMALLSGLYFDINGYLGSSVLFFLFITITTLPVAYLIVRLNRFLKILL
ncbi:surface polysaccharide O-acyltransferase-like enzyme [Dysgonomonas alginatilytica]|uniref:Surface polysaccharide O-acyltransferase-like enzyme n=1 Tax=Dysgonomonas alginatilytica TaxID=1605892 RepID=A0A2V3PPB0_9BACT|nr:acyltransferase family protein [Dysgonomonas alginatilytica]PXV63179.1 surface polysaccharide O-acyltransferase-like enzyme [Dysgonomonas alginatilytica]